jgi:hypothetical protein
VRTPIGASGNLIFFSLLLLAPVVKIPEGVVVCRRVPKFCMGS